jgi:hypothetical protein
LKELAAPITGGDPMNADKYVRRSLRTLSAELAGMDHPASPTTVAGLLRDLDYNLHVNVKRFTGPPHPDRNRQFEYIQGLIAWYRAEGWPILSVDSKKKELIGNFKNDGATWCQSGSEVNVHDFPTDAECRAVPYGLFDVTANRGHVVIGTSADTPAFAADAVGCWLGRIGVKRYPGAGAMLLLADAGGSNGCRPRLWKSRLQQLADWYGLVLTVCHYPTGASKWNPVEHRLFGPISVNWAGIPLRSREVMLGLIRGTTTTGGLRVTAQWRDQHYTKGVKVTNEEMAEIKLMRHDICPQWNYTIAPNDLWN